MAQLGLPQMKEVHHDQELCGIMEEDIENREAFRRKNAEVKDPVSYTHLDVYKRQGL